MKKFVFLLLSIIALSNFSYAQNGAALDFDGINDSCAIFNNSTLNVNQFTIETWLKWDGTSPVTAPFICSKGIENKEIHISKSNNSLRFIPIPGLYADTNANTLMPGNWWTHIACVFNPATSLIKIYINGLDMPLTISGTTPINTPIINENSTFKLGRRSDNSLEFKGALDEFRFWNKALPQSEIQDRMNCEIPTYGCGLIVNLHFNDGVAGDYNNFVVVASDSSGNNNNAFLSNFAKDGPTSNFIGTGAVVSGTNCTYVFTGPPSVATTQTLCGNVTIANLSATGSNIKWYENLRGGSALNTSTALTTDTNYYVSQTINSCESPRTAVAVTVLPAIDDITNINSCGTYTWAKNGQTYSQSGIYTGATANCITQKLNLTILPVTNNSSTVAACGSYRWPVNNKLYSTSGVYTSPSLFTGVIDNLANWTTNAENYNATIHSNSLANLVTSNSIAAILGNYYVNFSAPGGMYAAPTFISAITPNVPLTITFNSPVYGVSGNYFVTNVGNNVINANVTVNYLNGVSVSRTVNSNTDTFGYFSSNLIGSIVISSTQTSPITYISIKNLKIAVNPKPCTIDTLNLTVTPLTENIINVTANNSYTWNGTTYTTSGLYVGATNNCMVDKLNLTINGAALDFDGVNNRASITNNNSLNVTQFTVESMVKWNATTASFAPFICSNGFNTKEIHVTKSNNSLRFIPIPGLVVDTNSNTLMPNTWTHVACVFNPAISLLKVYINGIDMPLTLSGATPINTPISNVNSNFIVGNRIDGSLPFNGALDEFRFWNRALTQAEIQGRMNCEIPTTACGLITNFHFNQGAAGVSNTAITSLIDSSGFNNNATLENFGLTGTTSNFIATGGVISNTSCTNISIAAPTANAVQTFCGNATIASLTAQEQTYCGMPTQQAERL